MKNVKGIGLLIVLGVVGLVASQALFIVSEKEQVIITQFGEPIGEAITEPGLNVKVPFLHKANYFSTALLPGIIIFIKAILFDRSVVIVKRKVPVKERKYC